MGGVLAGRSGGAHGWLVSLHTIEPHANCAARQADRGLQRPTSDVSVALDADGFVALLERSEFIKRISGQDREIVSIVRRAKNDATRSEARLALFERRQQTVTTSECTAACPCRPAGDDR